MKDFPTFKQFIESQDFLTEMIVDGKIEDQVYMVAFERYIFLFTPEEAISSFIKIIKALRKIFPRNSFIDEISINYDSQYYSQNIEELLRELYREVRDCLAGKIENNILYVYGYVTLDFDHSLLFKKVLKQLDLTYYDITNFHKDKMLSHSDIQDFPDIGFHGTSSKNLTGILKTGLDNDTSTSNWGNIKDITKGTVFFTTKSITSLFHATNTSKLNDGIPIIIEFQIPFKDKVIADYDVEMFTGVVKFYKRKDSYFKKAISNKPLSLSKHFGIYGYRGKILPNKFTAIWIPKEQKENYVPEDFERFSVKEAIQRLNIFTF